MDKLGVFIIVAVLLSGSFLCDAQAPTTATTPGATTQNITTSTTATPAPTTPATSTPAANTLATTTTTSTTTPTTVTTKEATVQTTTEEILSNKRLANATHCLPGYFGPPECKNICGFCIVTGAERCDSITGVCPTPSKCADGYEGEKCDQPKCEVECSNGGKCIAPNLCFCGANINLVQPNCRDIRIRGLIGSVVAFLTVTFSWVVCGMGSKAYMRNKRKTQLQIST